MAATALASAPPLLSRTRRDLSLRARTCAALSESHLLTLHAIPAARHDARIALLTRWFRLAHTASSASSPASSASPSSDPRPSQSKAADLVAVVPAAVPMTAVASLIAEDAAATTATGGTRSLGKLNQAQAGSTAAVAAAAAAAAAVPAMTREEARMDRQAIVLDMISGVLELAFAHEFSVDATRTAVLLLLDLHAHVRRHPTASVVSHVAYFRHRLFSHITSLPDLPRALADPWIPALSPRQAKIVHAHVLSTYLRHLDAIVHVFSVAPALGSGHSEDELCGRAVGPPGSLAASLVALDADGDGDAETEQQQPDPFSAVPAAHSAGVLAAADSIGEQGNKKDDEESMAQMRSKIAALRSVWNARLDALECELGAPRTAAP
ncbi:hypothetical protein BC828DRAFT_391296 [Blastocladiella britannica]|nr:hypothetical protein BC828DRAFT_391296 [Blastocladiella britannica]